MILVIDNYDSFTYNLVQFLGELTAEVPSVHPIEVYRNDKIDLAQIAHLNPDAIVISPGPGRPENAGISQALIEQFAPSIAILGVCLGHQAIGQVYGAKIISAPVLMHGKTSDIYHQGKGVFAKLANPFPATRYHSLAIDRSTLPPVLEITAWVEDGTIMGVRHRDYPHLQGVQFHPESILTTLGKDLLRNFLREIPSLTL